MIDRDDICFLIGIILFASGLWLFGGVKLSLLIIGAILTFLPIYGMMRGRGDGNIKRTTRKKS